MHMKHIGYLQYMQDYPQDAEKIWYSTKLALQIKWFHRIYPIINTIS